MAQMATYKSFRDQLSAHPIGPSLHYNCPETFCLSTTNGAATLCYQGLSCFTTIEWNVCVVVMPAVLLIYSCLSSVSCEWFKASWELFAMLTWHVRSHVVFSVNHDRYLWPGSPCHSFLLVSIKMLTFTLQSLAPNNIYLLRWDPSSPTDPTKCLRHPSGAV